jgi:hypothetical protein
VQNISELLGALIVKNWSQRKEHQSTQRVKYIFSKYNLITYVHGGKVWTECWILCRNGEGRLHYCIIPPKSTELNVFEIIMWLHLQTIAITLMSFKIDYCSDKWLGMIVTFEVVHKMACHYCGMSVKQHRYGCHISPDTMYDLISNESRCWFVHQQILQASF